MVSRIIFEILDIYMFFKFKLLLINKLISKFRENCSKAKFNNGYNSKLLELYQLPLIIEGVQLILNTV